LNHSGDVMMKHLINVYRLFIIVLYLYSLFVMGRLSYLELMTAKPNLYFQHNHCCVMSIMCLILSSCEFVVIIIVTDLHYHTLPLHDGTFSGGLWCLQIAGGPKPHFQSPYSTLSSLPTFPYLPLPSLPSVPSLLPSTFSPLNFPFFPDLYCVGGDVKHCTIWSCILEHLGVCGKFLKL